MTHWIAIIYFHVWLVDGEGRDHGLLPLSAWHISKICFWKNVRKFGVVEWPTLEFKLYHFNSVVWGNRSLFPTLNFFICIMGWFLHCPPEGIGMRSNSLTCMKGLPAFLFVHTVLLGFSTWEVCSFFGAPLQRQVSFYGNYSWLITFI